MSRQTINGVEVVRSGEMTNEEVDKRREIQKRRIERLAAYIDENEMDWSDVERIDNGKPEDIIAGHLDDAYDKANRGDWK